jgi:hypothetical protein
MDIFGIHFHSWKPIMQNQVYFFRGHECQNSVTSGFRICKDCEKIQQYFYDSQGGCYSKVTAPIQQVLEEDVVTIDGSLILPKL